jgi:hypothetical protein
MQMKRTPSFISIHYPANAGETAPFSSVASALTFKYMIVPSSSVPPAPLLASSSLAPAFFEGSWMFLFLNFQPPLTFPILELMFLKFFRLHSSSVHLCFAGKGHYQFVSVKLVLHFVIDLLATQF